MVQNTRLKVADTVMSRARTYRPCSIHIDPLHAEWDLLRDVPIQFGTLWQNTLTRQGGLCHIHKAAACAQFFGMSAKAQMEEIWG
jgi:hypothetical protein